MRAANVIQISNPYSEQIALVGDDDKKARKKAQRINSTGAQGENDDKSSLLYVCDNKTFIGSEL